MPDMETTEKKRITLRSLWRLCPARHAVLLISLAWLAAYFLLRENRAVMNFLCKALVRPWHAFAGRLFSAVPFSVTEWVILFLAALGVVLLVLLIVWLIRRRWAKAYRTGMTILSVSAVMFALFCLWWGVLYYSDSFTEQAGLERRDISVQELETVTRYFAAEVNTAGEHVERGEDGVFAVDKDTIFRRSPDIYGGAEQIFPCLAAPAVRAKPVLLSRLLSYIRYTGFFFPYTAEANLNADSPACLLPSTIAHELAHLRGVAREDEANFCAVVACMESGDEDYRYSGALLAYIYLGNALYSADYDAWREVYSTLSENVRADLRANNDYWARFETPAADVSEKVYESFLQTYGDDRGMQSYGACVDLLTVYYLDTE
ncbi:MAG: DUF3810 domain-containing protein [Christensenellaceae bacterium]